jgi:3-oxoacyl-(acyl-carrier-protein) synthase
MSAGVREDLDVAVVGLAGRFPGAANCQEYWRNLVAGVDAITRFSKQELLDAGHDPAKVLDPSFVAANGVLEGAQYFDAGFFDFSPAEAALLDPQTRLMLECVWLALENAGVDLVRRGRNVGLFLGARSTVQWTVQALLSGHVQNVGGFLASQLANKDAMSTLISWKLGLQGPSFTVQTACSTSLVSVHLAVQSLLNGECDWAVAGGVSLLLPQPNGHVYQEGMLFSRDGNTRAFDAEASGSVFGSGLGAVVLRRASEAVADNDAIWALIKGSAMNNDGARKVGYTAPSVKGQSDVIRAALQLAEVEAAALDFIECHGTATSLGDSIEITALREVFGQRAVAPNRCALGAVKANIGHLDSAAGIAGLIKAVLAIRHGMIPPTPHFIRPNPQLDFEGTPFYVNTRAEPWPMRGGSPRLAAVSSFGVGGTNAHVVLQQHVPEVVSIRDANTSAAGRVHFFAFSAKDSRSLRAHLEAVCAWLVPQPELDLSALSRTLTRRHGHRYRGMFAASSRFELIRAMKGYLLLEQEPDWPTLVREALHEHAVPDAAQKLSLVTEWLSGTAREPAGMLAPPADGHVLMDVPGYAFLREDHGAAHITDEIWQRIATLVGSPGRDVVSRNAPGFLAPFWRPMRPPRVVSTNGGARSVVVLDQRLASNACWSMAGQEGLETIAVDIGDVARVERALASLSSGAPANRPLLLSLIVPPDLFGLTPDALQYLANFGRILAQANISGFTAVHIYLVATAATTAGHGEAIAASVLTSAATRAMALVLPQEVPGITCSFLCVHEPQADWTPTALAAVLRVRMEGPLKLEREGLFIADFRCLEQLSHAELDPQQLMGHTFVITGASGRMARAMAGVIARRYQGRLALISRQSADCEPMSSLCVELREAGAKDVAVFPNTMDNVEETVELFESIRDRMGDINTVIHTAGVIDGDSFSQILQLQAEHYAAQLQSKAAAAVVLTAVLERVPVEQCLVTSSMSAFFGGIAHAAYATANLFLDDWCRLQNMRPGGTRWVCLNWDTVHFDPRPHARALPWASKELALRAANIPGLFDASLRGHMDEPQKIISAGGFMDRLRDWGGRRSNMTGGTSAPPDTALTKPRPAQLACAYAAPDNPTQRLLAVIWGSILGLHGIGVDDSFVELGGDSLKTVVMAERVHQQLGKRFSIQQFIARPTIRGLEQQLYGSLDDPAAVLPLADPAAPIEATGDQELIYIHQLAFSDATYNMPLAFQCPGSVGVPAMAAALETIVRRHVILRCLFRRDDSRLIMVPQADARPQMSIHEASEEPGRHVALLEAFAGAPFDLQRDIPIRALVIQSRHEGASHKVVIVVHHIVCDAISLGILTAEFFSLLTDQTLPEVKSSFADYRLLSRASQTEEATRRNQAYWLGNLLPLPAPLQLPVTHAQDPVLSQDSSRGCTRNRLLPPHTGTQVRELCSELGVPVFTFFLGTFSLLLARIARRDSFLLGVPVTGRTRPEDLAVVGYLVNMLALKVEVDAELTFAEHLLTLHGQWSDSAPYQTYPMSTLLDDLRSEAYCRGRRGRHPLFDVLFNFLPRELCGANERWPSGFGRIDLAGATATFDMVLEVAEEGESFNCTVEYRQEAFDEAAVLAMLDAYHALADEVLAGPDMSVGSFQILDPGERQSAEQAAIDVDLEFRF